MLWSSASRRPPEPALSAAKQLSLTLDADLAAQVDEAVASGAHASASEVVEDALVCWRERRALEADPETLRRLWQEGLASGAPEPLDMAKIKGAARAKAKANAPEIDVARYEPT